MLKVHTGPTLVKQMQKRFLPLVTILGGEVLDGTEHLYFQGLSKEDVHHLFSVLGFRSWAVSGITFS